MRNPTKTPDINTILRDHPRGLVQGGAPMGAPNVWDEEGEASKKLYVQRIQFVDGDYAPDGTYWGGGTASKSLWCGFSVEDGTRVYVRANSRAEAEGLILASYPTARFHRRSAPMPSVDAFTQAYMICALWSSTDDDGGEMDAKHTPDNGSKGFDRRTFQAMVEDCKKFQTDNADLLTRAVAIPGYGVSSAGHDFWLSRNGHGAGFFDMYCDVSEISRRDESREVGDALQAKAEAFGAYNLFTIRGGKVGGE